MGNNNDLKAFVEAFSGDLSEYKNHDGFRNLTNSILNRDTSINIREHFLHQEIDLEWIEAIEKTIIPLDNILRAPRMFIKNEEEIVPIALAKGITTDSIKHLAQHTNMIESVSGDVVTPSKILEVRKEESYETYENRFLLTLLNKTSYFLDKRMRVINDTVHDNNQYEVNYAGQFNFNNDSVNYSISFNFESKNRLDTTELNDLINQDVHNLTPIQRIERLRKIMYDFQRSQFMKNMKNAIEIRPPLTMTNLLKKNPDYQACVELWVKLESYRGNGVLLNVVDRKETPSPELVEKMMQFTAMQYLFFKEYTTGLEENYEIEETASRHLERKIEQIVNTYDFDVDQIKKVFKEKIARREKKKFAIEKRFISIIKECIRDENDYRVKFDEKLSESQRLAHIRRRRADVIRNVQKHRLVASGTAKPKTNKKTAKVASRGKKVITNEKK